MIKLPCEVVRDLFPSYIDELTNEVTNHMIEEHLKECENCRKVTTRIAAILSTIRGRMPSVLVPATNISVRC